MFVFDFRWENDPLFHETDPRIRTQNKKKLIHNAVKNKKYNLQYERNRGKDVSGGLGKP